jgi:hypothetical protein
VKGVIIFQEQVERESVAISLKATKLTAQTLAKAFMAVVHKIQKEHQKAQTPRGEQSAKKLMNHNVPTSTIPIEGDKGLFNKIAKDWEVDYHFHKTGKNKYLLLFKSGQADAITGALSEYSAEMMKRAKDKRPPIMEQFKRAQEQVDRDKLKVKERPQKTRKIEVARE